MRAGLVPLVVLLGVACAMTDAIGEEKTSLKWTQDVGDAVEFLSFEADQPAVNHRMVKVTYQAKKACRQMSVWGHSYSKDDVQLDVFALTPGRFSVQPGQKFRDNFVATYEPGHYLVVDKVICLR
jgi:hypothetical protein